MTNVEVQKERNVHNGQGKNINHLICWKLERETVKNQDNKTRKKGKEKQTLSNNWVIWSNYEI
jgi:hypothetical protein